MSSDMMYSTVWLLMYDRCLLPSRKSPTRSKMCRSQSSLNSGGKGVTLAERCRGFSTGYGTFQRTGWIIIAEPLVSHTSLYFFVMFSVFWVPFTTCRWALSCLSETTRASSCLLISGAQQQNVGGHSTWNLSIL